MNNIVTSEGAAKTTMCALLMGAVLNIALDHLFIYVLDLGVAGAAIATAISQVVSTLVYLFPIKLWRWYDEQRRKEMCPVSESKYRNAGRRI